MLRNLGNVLIIFGILLVLFGILFKQGGKLKWIGKLPGDILVHKGNFTFYFPLATSLLASLVLSILLFVIFKILRKN